MQDLKMHIMNCASKAMRLETKLPEEVFDIHGMSGRMGRIFLNELCSPDWVKYLEIGSWKGSTACSASYGNPGKFIACDSFIELPRFGGTKNDLFNNRDKFGDKCNFTFIESDCWSLPEKLDDKFNIYFFDGPHDYDSHLKAITMFSDYMENVFILVVDDWNDKSQAVQNATEEGIRTCGFRVHYRNAIGDYQEADAWGWWNGLGIYLLEKS